MVRNSFNCIVVDGKDSAQIFYRPSRNFNFKSENVVKERMREKEITIEILKRIATEWAPYDWWMNDKFFALWGKCLYHAERKQGQEYRHNFFFD